MPDTPTIASKDHPDYYQTEKYRLWYKYWSDPKSETYANATRSAIKAYQYDPETQYQLARVVGSNNITKSNNIVQDLLEQKHWGVPKMIDFALSKMLEPDQPANKWWKDIMTVAGTYKMQPIVINNNTSNTQINNTTTEIHGEEAAKFRSDFEKFVYDKYSKKPEQATVIETQAEEPEIIIGELSTSPQSLSTLFMNHDVSTSGNSTS